MTDSDIHNLAVDAGAIVLGEEGTTQHYLLTADQLAALLGLPSDVPAIPPCPANIPPCPI